MGMGILRLSPSAFWSMTFGEVSLALDANRESEEMRERMEWERTRWLAAITINPHVKKRITPKDLATFPWEKKEKAADGIGILRQLAK